MAANRRPPPERVTSSGIKIIAISLVALALLALYANVQKFRRENIETVTVTVAASPTATP
ncbi:MAG: hypothetical protein M3O66_02260 [Verrucomicrobiota bacterium]|nr:hypothetical protein [Verrucomicrobiota bacterium]